jgi:ribokinase
VPGEATGTALIVVASGGENAIAVASGANARVTASMVAAALDRLSPGPGDVVLVGHEIPTAATREALRRGRAAGATTILNPAPATGINRSLFGLADVLTPNRGELAELCRAEVARTGARTADGRDVAEAARSLVTTNAEGVGPRAVLVSLGPAGALLVFPGGAPVDIPAPIVRAVDATGAGDALNGALAAGLAGGLTLEAAARRAVAAASRSTEAPGARAGLRSAAELDGVEDAHPS